MRNLELWGSLEVEPELPHSSSWTVPLICFQSFPFFGVAPAILNESGEELEGEAEGYLVRIWGLWEGKRVC